MISNSARSVIQVEHISKEYTLGAINHGTLGAELQSWWAKVQGRVDPNTLVADADATVPVPSDSSDEEDIVNKVDDARNPFLALDDISFEVKEGEVFGIIGENGAGKSTLLKILCRITAPTRGQVRIRGRIASLLEVGTGFHPELTGRENVFLNGAILGMTRAEVGRKFDEIVDFAGLARFIDTPVKRYSSGMYVRLAFAVAVHLDAEILVLDEVLAVGDFEFQKKCMEKVRSVTMNNRTVLLVSHSLSSVNSLCDRTLLLQRGKIAGFGQTQKVIETYVTKPPPSKKRFVALADRDDRTGSQDFRFVEVVVGTGLGGPLRSGEEAIINVCLESRREALRTVDVAVGLDNHLGERVAVFMTQAVGSTIEQLNCGRSLVSFQIPDFPLVAGRYSISLYGTVEGAVSDWVQSAASFEVAQSDFYGTGKTVPDGQGSIMIRYGVRAERVTADPGR